MIYNSFKIKILGGKSMYSILALLIGALIAVMLFFNGALESNVGAMNSLVIIHIVGLASITLIMIFNKTKITIKEKIPVYLFTGGAVGVALTFTNIVTIGAIGVALTTSLAVFGQLIFSSMIDHFGWFGMERYKFNYKKIVGFIIIAVGLVIMTLA